MALIYPATRPASYTLAIKILLHYTVSNSGAKSQVTKALNGKNGGRNSERLQSTPTSINCSFNMENMLKMRRIIIIHTVCEGSNRPHVSGFN